MGTRSNTVVINTGHSPEVVLLNMYRQMDGYLSGHGKDLYEFLKDMQICNGYGTEQQKGRWANGMGCLAAQIVANFKDGIGGIYLEKPVKTLDNDYGYIIRGNTYEAGDLSIEVQKWGKKVFSGTIAEFGEFIKREDSDE
jgi:hypothetical protein